MDDERRYHSTELIMRLWMRRATNLRHYLATKGMKPAQIREIEDGGPATGKSGASADVPRE